MSQVFVGNGRASLPERSESPSAAAEYSQIICDFTPVSPTRRHRLNASGLNWIKSTSLQHLRV